MRHGQVLISHFFNINWEDYGTVVTMPVLAVSTSKWIVTQKYLGFRSKLLWPTYKAHHLLPTHVDLNDTMMIEMWVGATDLYHMAEKEKWAWSRAFGIVEEGFCTWWRRCESWLGVHGFGTRQRPEMTLRRCGEWAIVLSGSKWPSRKCVEWWPHTNTSTTHVEAGVKWLLHIQLILTGLELWACFKQARAPLRRNLWWSGAGTSCKGSSSFGKKTGYILEEGKRPPESM